MRGKLDENMPVEAAVLLRGAGWSCDTVVDEGLGGAEDATVAEACRVEARVLFTLDLDFADIRTDPPSDFAGIVVFRPSEPDRDAILRMVTRVLTVLTEEWMEHQLWIVEPDRVRVRASREEGPPAPSLE